MNASNLTREIGEMGNGSEPSNDTVPSICGWAKETIASSAEFGGGFALRYAFATVLCQSDF